MNSRELIESTLLPADVKINGGRPWDIQVHDHGFYDRILSKGTLGLGEAYMDGWWDCDDLAEMVYKGFKFGDKEILSRNLTTLLHFLKSKLFNRQSKSRANKVAKGHYDIGNDLFEKMLDRRMVYTCAYWKNAKDLDRAQENKLDLVCRKLYLKRGQKILDIGCGWGSFAKFAAEKYGVSVVGVTVSKEQVELARKNCKGLSVEIRFQDYRDVDQKFDHVVSLGMFEHVGVKNYSTYMKVVRNCLKEEGLFLLHTIGGNKSFRSGNLWMEKYIFPNGMLPSIKQISKSCEGLFVVEDWHNFGPDYDKTLQAWFSNFDKSWPTLKEKYTDRFYRMWKFYLLSCSGLFRARHMQLWQIVLSPKGVSGGYESVR